VRDAFAPVLSAARRRDERLFVIDGDCAHSTRSGRFGAEYPGSFLNAGIAEQNMVGMAAGLALSGLRPVVSGFASIVVGRAAEQILLSVALPGLPVLFAGHYAGMSGALEGAPHHAITDLAFLRAVPGMRIWIPADDADVASVGEAALAEDGPAYLRLCRDPVPAVPGGRRIGTALRHWPSPGARVVIVACGVAVGPSVEAASILSGRGVPTQVVAVLRLKPLPSAELAALIQDADLVVTVEEHSVIGGLGSAVAEVIAEVGGPPLRRLGVQDSFTETGPYHQLLARYGIEACAIATSATEALDRRTAATSLSNFPPGLGPEVSEPLTAAGSCRPGHVEKGSL
jgi:transketolase